MEQNTTRRYDDIIHLPHHTSSVHPRLSAESRAAQFSPFAALTGYDAAILETGRLTEQRIELTEESRAVLDGKQQMLVDIIHERPKVTVTYFVPDERKSGGAYITVTGNVKRIDPVERRMVMMDGSEIPLDDVLELESEYFAQSGEVSEGRDRQWS